jgi:fumarate hydratase class II
LVTALSPVIGYDKASAIAHKANDAAIARGIADADAVRVKPAAEILP